MMFTYIGFFSLLTAFAVTLDSSAAKQSYTRPDPKNEAETETSPEINESSDNVPERSPAYFGRLFLSKLPALKFGSGMDEMNLVVSSAVCSCLGVTLFVILYMCHRKYIEEKFKKLEEFSVNDKKRAIRLLRNYGSTDLSAKLVSVESENPEMTSQTRTEI